MTNLEAALKYLSKGWPIIPINPSSKKPCDTSWKEFQTRLPLEDEVKSWWTNWPWANIGLITGKLSGVSVIDVDPRHGGTTEGLPETVKSQTGGGGFHYFFQYDSNVYSRNGIKDGLDLKSTGGYVILPPSTHASGNHYKWITPPFVNEFAPLPEEFRNVLKAKKESKFDPSILEGVEEGHRNESAASVTGKILRGLKEDEWGTTGWELLTGWNLKNPSPLELQELKTVFQSIAKTELARRQGENTQGKSVDLLERFEFEQKEASFKLKSGFPTLDRSIDGFRSGSLYCLAGLKKSGKSSLLMNILSNMLDNKIKLGFINTELSFTQFINRFTAISTKSLVKDIEKNSDVSKEWLKKNQGLLFYCDKKEIQSKFGFSKELLRAVLAEWVKNGVQAVAFDNLTTIGTEASDGQQGWQKLADFMDELVDFAKENKIVIFPVIHSKPILIFTETPQGIRKLLEEDRLEDVFKKSITTNRRPTAADLYGGGSALSQISGGVLLLWRPFQDYNDSSFRSQTMLILEDFRDGSILSEIEMRFEQEKLRFEEIYSVDINIPDLIERKNRGLSY